MQDLHLLGITTDRRHLILGSRPGDIAGSFRLAVDDDLLDAFDEVRQLLLGDQDELVDPVEPQVVEVRAEPRLSVREVQARLRSGDSVAEVAERAGVDEGWVERFAPPVRAEQRRIVERAQDTALERRSGPSSVSLRRAVAGAMAEKGITFTTDGFEAAWTSRLVGEDRWVVGFTFTQRGRERLVEWDFDAGQGTLTTSDRTASQLAWVAEGDTVSPPSTIVGAEVPGVSITAPPGPPRTSQTAKGGTGMGSKPPTPPRDDLVPLGRARRSSAATEPVEADSGVADPSDTSPPSTTKRTDASRGTDADTFATEDVAAEQSEAEHPETAHPETAQSEVEQSEVAESGTASSRSDTSDSQAPTPKTSGSQASGSKRAAPKKVATKQAAKKAPGKKRSPTKAVSKKTVSNKTVPKKSGSKRAGSKKRAAAADADDDTRADADVPAELADTGPVDEGAHEAPETDQDMVDDVVDETVDDPGDTGPVADDAGEAPSFEDAVADDAEEPGELEYVDDVDAADEPVAEPADGNRPSTGSATHDAEADQLPGTGGAEAVGWSDRKEGVDLEDTIVAAAGDAGAEPGPTGNVTPDDGEEIAGRAADGDARRKRLRRRLRAPGPVETAADAPSAASPEAVPSEVAPSEPVKVRRRPRPSAGPDAAPVDSNAAAARPDAPGRPTTGPTRPSRRRAGGEDNGAVEPQGGSVAARSARRRDQSRQPTSTATFRSGAAAPARGDNGSAAARSVARRESARKARSADDGAAPTNRQPPQAAQPRSERGANGSRGADGSRGENGPGNGSAGPSRRRSRQLRAK